jgi:small subunit ribosomal protein S4
MKKQRPNAKSSKETTQNNAPKKESQVKKSSEYGKQLAEKQYVKKMYGMREKQFRNFFKLAKKSKDATGSALLTLLERRLDNVVHRLKFAATRKQARQMVVHGHISLNGKRVFSPSILIKIGDTVSIREVSISKEGLVNTIISKQLATGIKVPEWIELDKNKYEGKILRLPVRTDIQAAISENFIVELYSK